MHTNASEIPWRKLIFTIVILALWVSIPVIGYVDATSTAVDTQCKGPLTADLSGTAAAGNTRGPSGTAQFREKGSNGLSVKVKGMSAAQTAALSVYIDDTSVGSITPQKGNGDLRLDTVSATINEGSTISLRNGSDTVLSGTFRCRGGGGSTNTNSGGSTNGGTNGNANGSGSRNTNGNTNMNSNMNMNTNTNANTGGTPRP